MGVYDVPATKLIHEIALDLESKFNVSKPAFIDYVKTGAHRERAPQQDNWYYVRMASILYRIFKEGPLGVGSLRTYYGGRKARGVKPHRFRKASGKIIRLCVQELEKLGFIKKDKAGRIIGGKGHSYLVKKSVEVGKKLKEEEATIIERIKEKEAKSREIEKTKAKEVELLIAEDKTKFKKKPKEERITRKERKKQMIKAKKEARK